MKLIVGFSCSEGGGGPRRLQAAREPPSPAHRSLLAELLKTGSPCVDRTFDDDQYEEEDECFTDEEEQAGGGGGGHDGAHHHDCSASPPSPASSQPIPIPYPRCARGAWNPNQQTQPTAPRRAARTRAFSRFRAI